MQRKWLSIVLVIMLMTGVSVPAVARSQDEDSSEELEVFFWWAGDEGPALEALINTYNEAYPDVNVTNMAMIGLCGSMNSQEYLGRLMLAGHPPDSFQVYAGEELNETWVAAGLVTDLTSLYQAEGWFEIFPPALIETMTYEGGIYSVPATIRRTNLMWYVPEHLAQWGIEVPQSWDEFLALCPVLIDQGVIPLALGERWTLRHLWENIALGTLGAEGWNALWAGKLDPAGPEMVTVWETFGRVLECTNFQAGSGSLSWQQAVDLAIDGEAAFNIMGDWTAGYLTNTRSLAAGLDYSWSPAPGTEGLFMWFSDSFGLPVSAPHPENALNWLRVVGSLKGQNALNPLLGSIPARTDAVAVTPERYSAFQQANADDWAHAALVGSMCHGTVATKQFSITNFEIVLDVFFMWSYGAQEAANAMAALCHQAGACGHD